MDGSFAALGGLNQPNNAVEQGPSSGRSHAHFDGGVHRTCATVHLLSLFDVHGVRLPGQRRGVHQHTLGKEHTVHRDEFTRTNADDVSRNQGFDRNGRGGGVGLIVQLPCFCGTEPHQAMQRVRGLEAGPGFEPISQQQKGDNEGGAVDEHGPVADHPSGEGARNHHHAPEVCGAGAKRHQDVHVGGASSHGSQRAPVETGPCPCPNHTTKKCGDEVVDPHTGRVEGTVSFHGHEVLRTQMAKVGHPHRQHHACGGRQQGQANAPSSAPKFGLPLAAALEGIHGLRSIEPSTVDGLDHLGK